MSYRHSEKDDPGGGGTKHEQRSVVFEVLPPTYEHVPATMGGSLDEANAFNTRHYSDSEDEDTSVGTTPFNAAPHSTGALASRRYGTRVWRPQQGRAPSHSQKAATSELIERMEGVRESSMSSSLSTPTLSQDSNSSSSDGVYHRQGSSLNLSRFGTTGAFNAEADEFSSQSSDSRGPHKRRHSSDQITHTGFSWQVKTTSEVDSSYEDTNDPQVVDLASWTPRSTGANVGSLPSVEDLAQPDGSRGTGSMASPRSSASLTEGSSLSSPGFKVRKFSPSTHRRRRGNTHSSKSRTYTATSTASDSFRHSFSTAPSTNTTPPRYRQFSYSSEAVLPSESLSSSSELASTAPSTVHAFKSSRTSAPTSPLGSQFSSGNTSARSQFGAPQHPLRFSSQSISDTATGVQWALPSNSRHPAAVAAAAAATQIRSPPPKRKRRFSTSALDEPGSGDTSQTEDDTDHETASNQVATYGYDQYGISDDSDPNAGDLSLSSHRNRRSRRGNHPIDDEGTIDAQYMDASSPESSSSVLRTLLQTGHIHDTGFDSSTHSAVDCTSTAADVDSAEFSDSLTSTSTTSSASTASLPLHHQVPTHPEAAHFTFTTSERRRKGHSSSFEVNPQEQPTKERKSRRKRRSGDETQDTSSPTNGRSSSSRRTSSNEMNVDSDPNTSTSTPALPSDSTDSTASNPHFFDSSSSKSSRSSRSLKKRSSIHKDSIMQTDQNPLNESGSSTSSLNRAVGALPISSSSSASNDSLVMRHHHPHAHTSPRLSSSSAPGSSSSNARSPAPLASASAANLHTVRAPDFVSQFTEHGYQGNAMVPNVSVFDTVGLSQHQQPPAWISGSSMHHFAGALKSDDPNLANYRQPRRHQPNPLRSNSSDDGDSPYASDSDASYGADVDADALTNDDEMMHRVISSGGGPSALLQAPNSHAHQRPRSGTAHKSARLLQDVTRHGQPSRSNSLPEAPRQFPVTSASHLRVHPEEYGEDNSQGPSADRSPELDTVASTYTHGVRRISRPAFTQGHVLVDLHTPHGVGTMPNSQSTVVGGAAANNAAGSGASRHGAVVSDTETLTGGEKAPKWTDEYGTDDDMVYHSNAQGMDSSMEDVHMYAPFQIEKMDMDASSGTSADTTRQSSLSMSSSSVGAPPQLNVHARPQRPASSTVLFPITRSGSQEFVPAPAMTPRKTRNEALTMKATKFLVQTYQVIQRNIKTRRDAEEAGARSKAATAPYYYPQVDEVLSGRYKIVGYLGRGSFGVVVKAIVLDTPVQPRNAGDAEENGGTPDLRLSSESVRAEYLQPNKLVAIKISRKGSSFLQQGKREVSILERIHAFQETQPNQDLDLFVRALDSFFHEGHLCIVFELLADSLFDLIKYSWEVRPDRPGLSLRMVRKMTHQLICALITLRNSRIIHCDLKPENIALAQPNRPRLKILDFGSSCLLSDSPINQFPYIQSRYYRAPEILLGTGYSCAIDIWSLGCIIAELYLGRPLFEGSNSITQLYCVIDVLGMPAESVLKNAVHLSRYFQRTGVDSEGRSILDPTVKTHTFTRNSIRELIESKNEPNTPLHIRYFSDLITRMLEWDPTQRITPLEAVNHNFVLYGPKTNADGT